MLDNHDKVYIEHDIDEIDNPIKFPVDCCINYSNYGTNNYLKNDANDIKEAFTKLCIWILHGLNINDTHIKEILPEEARQYKGDDDTEESSGEYEVGIKLTDFALFLHYYN